MKGLSFVETPARYSDQPHATQRKRLECMQCVRLGDRICQGSRLLQLDGLYVASESCLGVFGCLPRAERLSDPMCYADLGTRSKNTGSADNSTPVL